MLAPDAPTLTEKSTPCPGVEVLFSSIDGDAATITVWRIADGVKEAVSGAFGAVVSGAFVVTDWKVPFGVVSTYFAEIFDADGASVTGAQGNIQVDESDVWLQSQTDPTASTTILLEDASFGKVSRTRRTQQVWVAGLPRPFEQDWGKGPIESLPFTAYTRTAEEALALDAIISASPLLIRTPPSFVTLPRLLSASVRTPEQEPLDWATGGSAIVWSLMVDEVQPVSAAILRPLVTYQDWADAFPSTDFTYADVQAVYGAGTYLDAQRNPPSA